MKHICSIVLLSASCALAQSTGLGVLAKIGPAELKLPELKESLGNLPQKDLASLADNPALLNQLVRSVLVQKLVLSKVAEAKYDEQPEVKAQLERVRQTTLVESYLQKQAEPMESFPNDAELELFYNESKAALQQSKKYRLAQIYLTNANAKTKLEALRKALAGRKPDFSSLANEFSDETASASKGGEIGWVADTDVQPEIRTLLPKLTLNAISEPIKMEDGWHVVRVLDSKAPYTPLLDEVRAQLRQQMRSDKIKINTKEVLAKLLQENPLSINELTLAQALKQSAP